jgi:hypothetical protein
MTKVLTSGTTGFVSVDSVDDVRGDSQHLPDPTRSSKPFSEDQDVGFVLENSLDCFRTHAPQLRDLPN